MASDGPIITEAMLEEEKQLAAERAKEEAAEKEALLKQAAPKLEHATFSKLDELLNQTQIYSQFLLEKMDDIALVRSFLSLPIYVCTFPPSSSVKILETQLQFCLYESLLSAVVFRLSCMPPVFLVHVPPGCRWSLR